jgi:hypothetical protein
MSERTITVTYISIDRVRKRRQFKTLAGAQRFAQKWLGETPEVGWGYAVSSDGVGKVEVWGATLDELFPKTASYVYDVSSDQRYDEYKEDGRL